MIQHPLGRVGLVTAAFNLGMLVLLLTRPFPADIMVTVDDLAQAAGPFLMLLCLLIPELRRRTDVPAPPPVKGVHRLAPTFLQLGIFGFGAGQVIWANYELVQH